MCVNGAAFVCQSWSVLQKKDLCAAQSHHPAIDVASDEIAYNEARVEDGYFHPVVLGVLERHYQIIECVGYAVSESADDEERDSEEKRKIILLPCKGHSRGHDEAAANT